MPCNPVFYIRGQRLKYKINRFKAAFPHVENQLKKKKRSSSSTLQKYKTQCIYHQVTTLWIQGGHDLSAVPCSYHLCCLLSFLWQLFSSVQRLNKYWATNLIKAVRGGSYTQAPRMLPGHRVPWGKKALLHHTVMHQRVKYSQMRSEPLRSRVEQSAFRSCGEHHLCFSRAVQLPQQEAFQHDALCTWQVPWTLMDRTPT